MNNYLTLKLKLKLLTPIIVGTERTLDGFEYVIDKSSQSQQAAAFIINLPSFLSSLAANEQKNLLNQLEQSVIKFREAIKDKAKKIVDEKHYLEAIEVTRPVVDKYYEASDANQLLIGLLPRSLNGPYLPGSSVKGALRTAVVALASKKDAKNEKEALQYKTTFDDPFRAIKISDSLESLPTYLVKAEVHNKKNDTWQRLEKLMLLKEAFKRSINENVVTASFLVTFDRRSLNKEGSFKMALTPESIAQACQQFYAKVYEKDWEHFASGIDRPIIESSWLQQLKESFRSPKTFPIRIGWGCGALSLSVKLFNSKAKIKTSTSRRLIKTGEKYLPIGWAIGHWEDV